jgi:hypothetical protein
MVTVAGDRRLGVGEASNGGSLAIVHDDELEVEAGRENSGHRIRGLLPLSRQCGGVATVI